jgi:hypothetical protein
MTETYDPNDWTVRLQERVTHFSTDARQVVVTFALSPAEYHLSADRPDFADQLARLASAWRAGEELSVVVDGTTIVSVDAVEGG